MSSRRLPISLAALLCLGASGSHALVVNYDDNSARATVFVGKSNYLTDTFAPVSALPNVDAQINGAPVSAPQTGPAYFTAPAALGVSEQQASIIGTGQLSLASGDVPYQFGGQAWANASYGQLSAQAQGHVQSLITTSPSFQYESVGAYGSASASTLNGFMLQAPISPGDASPPGTGPQILTVTMTVTGHTVADPLGTQSPFASFNLRLTNDPTGSLPTAAPLQQTWTVSDVGDWTRTFSLAYEITAPLSLQCLDPFLSKYVGCGFFVGALAGVSVDAGTGSHQQIGVKAALSWSLSDPESWQGVSSDTRHWGDPLPAVPEPETWALFMMGAGVVWAAAHRQRQVTMGA